MSRRFRYYALPPGAAAGDTESAVVVRLETGQDYDTFETVRGGRWVPDNAAYEYVHGSGQARECEPDEAREIIAETYGVQEAQRLVPRPSG